MLTPECRFKARYMKYAGPRNHQRFLQHSIDYVTAVGKEAEYREQGEILNLDSYETLRRENSAVRLCFSLCELCLGIDLPDEVFENEDFMTLYWAACDMVCWSNVSSILFSSEASWWHRSSQIGRAHV